MYEEGSKARGDSNLAGFFFYVQKWCQNGLAVSKSRHETNRHNLGVAHKNGQEESPYLGAAHFYVPKCCQNGLAISKSRQETNRHNLGVAKKNGQRTLFLLVSANHVHTFM